MNAMVDLGKGSAGKIHSIAKEFKNFGHEVKVILPKPSKIISKDEFSVL